MNKEIALAEIDKDEKDAIDFVTLISTGYSKIDAYCEVFGIDKVSLKANESAYNVMSVKVSRYVKRPLVQKHLESLATDVHLLFADKHYKALEEQYNLAMTARSEKVRADALHQFIQNTRKPDKYVDRDAVNDATIRSAQLLEDIANVFKSAKSRYEEATVDTEVISSDS